MTTAQQQMEDLLQATHDTIEALEKERASYHEAGAKVQDQITKLKLGGRRP